MTHTSHAVWVVTNDDDPTADLVIKELHHRAVPVVRFDSGHDALAYAVVDTPEHIRAALYAYLDHFQLVFGAFDSR